MEVLSSFVCTEQRLVIPLEHRSTTWGDCLELQHAIRLGDSPQITDFAFCLNFPVYMVYLRYVTSFPGLSHS